MIRIISNGNKWRRDISPPYVRSNYSNRDGMEPVISRINLDGKRLRIGSTGVKVMPGHWNGLTGRVRGDDEQAARGPTRSWTE